MTIKKEAEEEGKNVFEARFQIFGKNLNELFILLLKQSKFTQKSIFFN